MNNNYAYFIVSLLLLCIWIILYILKPSSRRKMLILSLLTAPLGLTEPLFVPSYWLPFTLFDLAGKYRFDLESFLFSFAVGGVAAVMYEGLLGAGRKMMSRHQKHQERHRRHRLALLSPFISFAALYLFTPLNPIYSASLAMGMGAIATSFCRPDLIKPMVIGSTSFLTVYFAVFLIGFVLLFPGYVEVVWNLAAISKILIFGVPIEELFFAISLGAMWSSVYEHFYWYRFIS